MERPEEASLVGTGPQSGRPLPRWEAVAGVSRARVGPRVGARGRGGCGRGAWTAQAWTVNGLTGAWVDRAGTGCAGDGRGTEGLGPRGDRRQRTLDGGPGPPLAVDLLRG